MREDQFGAVVDRRELPGNAAPCPLRRAFGKPANFLIGVQFGHLKLHDKRPLPKAKFSKRAHLWFDSRLVGPPANDFVLLSYGAPDALRGGFYGEFFDNSCHRCSFLLNVARRLYLTYDTRSPRATESPSLACSPHPSRRAF